MQKIILLSVVLLSQLSFGQADVKQLRKDYFNEKLHDTIRVDAALGLADEIYFLDPDSAIVLVEQAREWSRRSNYVFGLSQVDGYLGYLYQAIGDYSKAIEAYSASEKYNRENGNYYEQMIDMLNYGALLDELGKSEDAVELYRKSLELAKEYGDPEDLESGYNNIGVYHSDNENYDSALFYFLKALDHHTMESFNASLMGNIGYCYMQKSDYTKAAYYFNRAEEEILALGDTAALVTNYAYRGELALTQNNVSLAEEHAQKAYRLSRQYPSRYTEGVLQLMSSVYAERKNWKLAYQYQDTLYRLANERFDKEAQNTAINEAFRMEYDSKLMKDSLNDVHQQEMKDLEHEAEIETEKNKQLWMYAGIGVALILLVLMWKNLRDRKVAQTKILAEKQEADRQRLLVVEKNEEIMDSIQYAKRIQNAILPPDKMVRELLPDSFILYKPKDVVAGDFYWLEEVNGIKFFAAADCTGHGVPGAMVSVVCNNGLNRSVREYGISDPGQILDKTRSLVIQEFEKSEDEVKDGMDIALCALDGNTLYYAGAHNPLWIVRSGSEEIEEYRANKQPIGKFRQSEPFDTHKISLNKGDTVYVFSDGYPDQFGGSKGKKFKSSNFRELLVSINGLTMDDQKNRINDVFENWKGSLEQIDDVCVIGVRV